MAKAEVVEQPLSDISVPKKIWRWFRSMRTAIVLVLVLAVASIIGTLLPQYNLDPTAVAGFSRDYPALSKFFNVLSFFNVYYSWWFILLTAMLFTSLTACLIQRTQTYVSKLRNPVKGPANDKFIANQPNKAGYSISIPNELALQKIRDVLSGRRYLLRDVPGADNQVFAEKGRFGGLGSLLFHYMFFLLLVGVVYGKTTGYEGFANIVEGESFTENYYGFSGPVAAGPFFKNNYKNFKVVLDDFQVSYQPNGQPKDFVSKVRLYDEGKLITKKELRVNSKLMHKGVKLYQSSYGWAPRIIFYKDGTKIYDKATSFQGDPAASQGQVFPNNDLAVSAYFVPDLQENDGNYGAGSKNLNNPALHLSVTGKDEKGADKELFNSNAKGIVKLKDKKDIGDGYTVEFPEIKEYTGLQVIRDDGVPIVYTSFVLAIIGLYMTFYMSHRKIWTMVMPGEKGKSKLLIGGMSEKNKGAFEIEFANIMEEAKIELKEGTNK